MSDYNISYNGSLIRNINLTNSNDYKAISDLFKCFSLLSNLKKTILIYNDNYVVVVNNKNVKYVTTYKFNDVELIHVYKLYMASRSEIFINASSRFIKFRTEHERFLRVMVDCCRVNLPRQKITFTGLKMLIICLYLVR